MSAYDIFGTICNAVGLVLSAANFVRCYGPWRRIEIVQGVLEDVSEDFLVATGHGVGLLPEIHVSLLEIENKYETLRRQVHTLQPAKAFLLLHHIYLLEYAARCLHRRVVVSGAFHPVRAVFSRRISSSIYRSRWISSRRRPRPTVIQFKQWLLASTGEGLPPKRRCATGVASRFFHCKLSSWLCFCHKTSMRACCARCSYPELGVFHCKISIWSMNPCTNL
ncbi:hypothetical protein OF83DRAFT_772908 [Amylostereum chailletii]|nr:hypothetical protein OF83DRAFT_772908 [Amylostereum chailletii]